MALKPQGNNVLAGTSLAIARINSPDFVTGVSGWTINQDGSAEFNNVTIRGGQVIGGTSLYYSTPLPAPHTLVASIGSTTFTDPQGNVVLAGEVTYHFTAIGGPSLAVAVNDAGITWYTAATATLGPWVQSASISSFQAVPGLFVTASLFKFTSGDGNVYSMGQLSMPAAPIPQTINSMSAQTITGCGASVAARSYRIRVAGQFSGNQAAGNPSFQIAGPASSTEWGNAEIWDTATGVNRKVANRTGLLWQGPTLSANTWIVTVDAFATFTNSGALTLQAFTSVAADTFNILHAVFDVIPVS